MADIGNVPTLPDRLLAQHGQRAPLPGVRNTARTPTG